MTHEPARSASIPGQMTFVNSSSELSIFAYGVGISLSVHPVRLASRVAALPSVAIAVTGYETRSKGEEERSGEIAVLVWVRTRRLH
jgi:hypothetical protein